MYYIMPRKDCKFFVTHDVQKRENSKLWNEMKTILEKLLESAKNANLDLDFMKYDDLINPKTQRVLPTSDDLLMKHFGGRGNHDEPESADKTFKEMERENDLLKKLIKTWNAEYSMFQKAASQDDSVICFDDWCNGFTGTSTRMEGRESQSKVVN